DGMHPFVNHSALVLQTAGGVERRQDDEVEIAIVETHGAGIADRHSHLPRSDGTAHESEMVRRDPETVEAEIDGGIGADVFQDRRTLIGQEVELLFDLLAVRFRPGQHGRTSVEVRSKRRVAVRLPPYSWTIQHF